MEVTLEGGVIEEEAVKNRILVLTGSREQASAEISSNISLLRETVCLERVKTSLRESEEDAERGLPFLSLSLKAFSAKSLPSRDTQDGSYT